MFFCFYYFKLYMIEVNIGSGYIGYVYNICFGLLNCWFIKFILLRLYIVIYKRELFIRYLKWFYNYYC